MILYIHPKTNMTLKQIIPMSMPAIANRLRERWELLARFYDEWTVDEVRRASLVIMDIHWYLSIISAQELSCKLKAINPKIKIAAGGASATVFARQILRDSSIDYIIRGDGEIPMVKLAEAILDGNTETPDIEQVPNLKTRDFESKTWYHLTEDDINANNYRDISWFPSLQRGCERLHRWSRGRIYPVHPILLVSRGCPVPCRFCLGSIQRQRSVFRRGWVSRAPEKVRDDLIAYSADPKVRFVSVYQDFFACSPPSYAETVLNRPYDLNIYMEFIKVPTQYQMNLLAQSFQGGDLRFTLGEMHATSAAVSDLDDLIARIKQVQESGQFQLRISYVGHFVKTDTVYADAFRRIVRETQVPMDRMDYWWYDVSPEPDEQGFSTEEGYAEACGDPNPYRLYNIMFRCTVLGYRFFPKLTLTLLSTFTHTNGWLPTRLLPFRRGAR